jgi:hypothetical protein
MSKIAWIMTFLSATFASTSSAQTKNENIAVYPKGMQNAPTIALGELIYQSIPSDGRIDWDALQIPAVRWLTTGVGEDSGGSFRYGLVRVRAGGQTAKVLRQGWEELSWSVTLRKSSDAPLAEGVSEISIEPGFNFLGQEMTCFGRLFQGCYFPSSALRGPKHTLALACSVGGEGNGEDVFRATTSDGRVGIVVWERSTGSGGSSTSLRVLSQSARTYCSEAKSRWP